MSFIKNETTIEKITININQLDVNDLKNFSKSFKPSNLNSFLNNKVKGKLNTELEVYLDKNNFLDNFIARGNFENLKAEIFDNIELDKTFFTFFADSSDILIKDLSGVTGPIKISDGDIKIKFSPELSIKVKFKNKP